MKELYLSIAVLCFLGAGMIYCLNKSIQAIKELNEVWKKYKQSQIEIINTLRKNK